MIAARMSRFSPQSERMFPAPGTAQRLTPASFARIAVSVVVCPAALAAQTRLTGCEFPADFWRSADFVPADRTILSAARVRTHGPQDEHPDDPDAEPHQERLCACAGSVRAAGYFSWRQFCRAVAARFQPCAAQFITATC